MGNKEGYIFSPESSLKKHSKLVLVASAIFFKKSIVEIKSELISVLNDIVGGNTFKEPLNSKDMSIFRINYSYRRIYNEGVSERRNSVPDDVDKRIIVNIFL